MELRIEIQECDGQAIANAEADSLCLVCFAIAGPKLGDGPRWNLKRAVGGKKRVEKEDVERELAEVEERSRKLGFAGDIFMHMENEMDYAWEEVETYVCDSDSMELVDLLDIKDDDKSMADSSVDTIRAYIEQLEAEIRTLKEGSDARCTKMLQQAMEGSDDADVDFLFGGGSLVAGLQGHQGMLCAGSEEYAGLFRSGMVEAQEGKIRVPPCVGAESFRGFLEWLYLGELPVTVATV